MVQLTVTRLRELLHYDSETGDFRWLKGTRGHHANRIVRAGKSRYIKIKIDQKIYLAHRLAWLWMTGMFPVREIDHINRNRYDNRWTNLRDVTRSQNRLNNAAVGVYWRANRKHWRVVVRAKEYGTHRSKEDAMQSAMLLRMRFGLAEDTPH